MPRKIGNQFFLGDLEPGCHLLHIQAGVQTQALDTLWRPFAVKGAALLALDAANASIGQPARMVKAQLQVRAANRADDRVARAVVENARGGRD